MWTSILKVISQYLLLPLFKEFFLWLKQSIERKSEQKNRHKENEKKVEKYENSHASDSSDDFSQLP
jgi:hypothetical protein